MTNPAVGGGYDNYQAQIDQILGRTSPLGGNLDLGGYGYNGLGNYNSPLADLNNSLAGLNLGGGGGYNSILGGMGGGGGGIGSSRIGLSGFGGDMGTSKNLLEK